MDSAGFGRFRRFIFLLNTKRSLRPPICDNKTFPDNTNKKIQRAPASTQWSSGFAQSTPNPKTIRQPRATLLRRGVSETSDNQTFLFRRPNSRCASFIVELCLCRGSDACLPSTENSPSSAWRRKRSAKPFSDEPFSARCSGAPTTGVLQLPTAGGKDLLVDQRLPLPLFHF